MDNSTKEKMRAALGMNMPEATDIIKRDNYKTDEAYLSALVEFSAKLKDPEVQRTLRKAEREQIEYNEEEVRKAQQKEYDELLKTVELGELDQKAVEQEATQRAHDDLAAGKIGVSEHGERIIQYARELTDKRKHEIAAAKQFNNSLRNTWRK